MQHLNGKVTNIYNRTSIAPTQSRVCKGNPTAQEFLQWFEGSVVCDKRGYPLVQYHGMHTDIGQSNFFPFSHFGDVNVGNLFSGYHKGKVIDDENYRGGTVYPVILNVKNPLGIPDIKIHPLWNIIKHLNQWDIISKDEADWVKAAKDKRAKHPICKDKAHIKHIETEYPSALYAHYKLTDCSGEFWAAERLTKLLLKKGYDGFVYTNTHECPGSISWIIPDPKNQIRMATDVAACGGPITHKKSFLPQVFAETALPEIAAYIERERDGVLDMRTNYTLDI